MKNCFNIPPSWINVNSVANLGSYISWMFSKCKIIYEFTFVDIQISSNERNINLSNCRMKKLHPLHSLNLIKRLSQNIFHFKFKFCKQIRWHQKHLRLEFSEFSTNDRLKVRKCQLRWHLVEIQSLPEYNWMENCQLGDNHQSLGEKGNFSNVSRVSTKFKRNLLVWNKVFLVTEAERQTITNHELMIWKNEKMSGNDI